MDNLIDQKWYAVESPWGDGTWIVAGNPDPHVGIFVCDCLSIDKCDEENEKINAINRVMHIVGLHNQTLQQVTTKKSKSNERNCNKTRKEKN